MLRRDLQEALRGWLRRPRALSLSVTVLAVGIAATALIGSLVHGVLLRPLPHPEANRLHSVWFAAPGLGIERVEQSPGTWAHLRQQSEEEFSEFGLYAPLEVALTEQGPSRRLMAVEATAGTLEALRPEIRFGRLLAQRDEAPEAQPVVVVTESFARRIVGDARGAVGSWLRLDGIDREIVGVLPETFRYPAPDVDLWLPMTIDESSLPVTNFSYRAVARLRNGMTAERATAKLTVATQSLADAYPDDLSRSFLEESGMEPLLVPLKSDVVGPAQRMLRSGLLAVFVVLLIATANVANLLLVQADARSAEQVLRSALGASRRNLLRRHAAEGLVLGLIAALPASLGAWFGLSLLPELLGQRWGLDLPRLHEIEPSFALVLTVVLSSGSLGLALGTLVGLRHLRSAGRSLHAAAVRSSTASGRSMRLRSSFVVAQVALGSALLIAAGLLARSFVEIRSLDLGFDPDGLQSLYLTLPAASYDSAEKSLGFWQRAREELTSHPAVADAAIVSRLPFDYGGQNGTLVEGHESPDGLPFVFIHRLASPNWFEVADVPVLAGRGLEAADERWGERDDAPVVVSQAMALRFWGSPEAALGERVRPAGTKQDGSPLPWHRIVGVVGDLRGAGLWQESKPTLWFPMTPDAGRQLRSLYVVLRRPTSWPTADGPALSLAEARQAIAAVDRNIPLARFRTGAQLVAAETAQLRFTLVLVILSAVVATTICSVGLFAILSTLVELRRRELGIRLAVGATVPQVRWLITRSALILTWTGWALGSALSLPLRRGLEGFLYEVPRIDPVAFFAVASVLSIVAVLASSGPAARAGRTDPNAELRSE